jgi:hypothetical protein
MQLLPIAQRISNKEKQINVVAATGYITFGLNKDKKLEIKAVSSVYSEDRAKGKFLITNQGYKDKGFVTYKGGKKITPPMEEKGKDIKVRKPGSGQ